jgi:stress-induced morphogen
MEMHRMVYGALEDLIPKKIHALSIKARNPNV